MIVPRLEPGDHDSSAIWSQCSLGSIKIQSVVNCLNFLPVEDKVFLAAVSYDTESSVSAVEFQAFCLHILRRGQQDSLVIKEEKIRTLPHFSILIFTFIQNAYQTPVSQIPGSIYRYLTAAVIASASHNRIEDISLLPDLGIPEIL